MRMQRRDQGRQQRACRRKSARESIGLAQHGAVDARRDTIDGQVGRHDEASPCLVGVPGLDPDHAPLAEEGIEIVDDARNRKGGLRLGNDLRENRLQHRRLAKLDQVRRDADAQR